MTKLQYYISEGTRIFLKGLKTKLAPKKYQGSAKEICSQIVADCWNERFFQTSTTNFTQFWTRDFGWCTQSLLELGYKKEVHQTLRYALHRFRVAGKVTTTITPKGKPYDFPKEAIDSLPWLLHSIRVSQFEYYSYRPFLRKMVRRYFEKFIDQKTGLVKRDIHVSSMKDFSVRKSSCYDNCMVALLAKNLDVLKIINPFKEYDYEQLILDHFWNGNYFYDDLQKKKYVAGDANVFPFLLGIVKDNNKLEKVVAAMKQAQLFDPFPLKYTSTRAEGKFIAQEMFLYNYEGNSIWTHMGPLFIKVLEQVDKKQAREYKQRYAQLIEHHGNYLEVFTPEGKPFSTPFYACDRGMLWAANFLTL